MKATSCTRASRSSWASKPGFRLAGSNSAQSGAFGTVWGHGAYVAPDWSADWLHREAVALTAIRTDAQRGASNTLSDGDLAAVQTRVRDEMRRNTYDETSGTVKVSKERAQAIREVADHYDGLFGTDPKLAKLRDQYAMTEGALPDAENRKALTAFFFWSAWAATTDRPEEPGLSYTSNWPHEPLVGNTMSTSAAMWSMASIILLLAGIAAMLWLHKGDAHELEAQVPAADPLLGAKATPSMKATRKYFFIVIALMLLQIGMGAITAHYAVEGQAFFGLPLAQILPYTVSRTIHTQIGVFWIAVVRQGAEAAEAGGGRSVLRAGVRGARVDRDRLAGHAAAPRCRLQLLDRQPGP